MSTDLPTFWALDPAGRGFVTSGFFWAFGGQAGERRGL